jgi:hypothetical protein
MAKQCDLYPHPAMLNVVNDNVLRTHQIKPSHAVHLL